MNDAYSLSIVMPIYRAFSGRYGRATEIIFKLFGLKSSYIIDRLKDKNFMAWYRFKRSVKLLEKELIFLDYNNRSWKYNKAYLIRKLKSRAE